MHVCACRMPGRANEQENAQERVRMSVHVRCEKQNEQDPVANILEGEAGIDHKAFIPASGDKVPLAKNFRRQGWLTFLTHLSP